MSPLPLSARAEVSNAGAPRAQEEQREVVLGALPVPRASGSAIELLLLCTLAGGRSRVRCFVPGSRLSWSCNPVRRSQSVQHLTTDTLLGDVRMVEVLRWVVSQTKPAHHRTGAIVALGGV